MKNPVLTGVILGIVLGIVVHFLTGCASKPGANGCKVRIIGNDQNNRYERVCNE